VPELDLPPRIGGKYRPLRLLGKGGMGAVYEVEHEHTGQHLALKVLTTQPGASVERFRREARAASLIKSDHIVRVTDADFAPELGGAPFLVMELLEGQDLERALRDGPAPPAQVIGWLRHVARALGKAHEAGLVHRDLKPENLFLTRGDGGEPLVKVLDFGIAKMAADASALTASDAFLGTPGYMAPEQTDSRGPPVTFRADLYALGLIAFRLLMGRSYWRGGSLAQLLAQMLAEPMPPASERGSTLGPGFDEWFRRACERAPDQRFASADEQVEALAAALGLPEATRSSQPAPTLAARSGETQGAPSLNGSSTDLTTARRRTARRRLFGGGLAASLISVGLAAALLRGPATKDTPSAASGLAQPLPAATAPSSIPSSPIGFAAAAGPALPTTAGPDAAAPAAPSLQGLRAPAATAAAAATTPAATTPAAASSAARGSHPSSAASGRTPALPAATGARDPLEGPW
jgi:eukaryotic-like serine/threonine-protein kinase